MLFAHLQVRRQMSTPLARPSIIGPVTAQAVQYWDDQGQVVGMTDHCTEGRQGHKEIENHKTIYAARDLWRSTRPASHWEQALRLVLPRALPSHLLNISRVWNSTTSLGSLFQCLFNPTVKMPLTSRNISREATCGHRLLSCDGVCLGKCFHLLLHNYHFCRGRPLKPPLPQAEHIKLLQPLFRRQLL